MSDWRQHVYRQYVSVHYGNHNRLDPSGYELAAQRYARTWDPVLPVDRDVSCLDIGCGPGLFLYYLRRQGFKQIHGVDLSSEGIYIARDMGFDVTVSDATTFLVRAYADGKKYGLLAAIDVIEHLTRQELFDFLIQAAAVIEEDGRMLIRTINASSLIGGWGRYMDITHQLAFTEDSLRELFLSTGFRRVEIVETVDRRLVGRIRKWLKRAVYWGIYRVIEGWQPPRAVDVVITAAVYK